MAIPRRRDERDDLLWNPALPGVPAPVQRQPPGAPPAADPFAQPATPARPPIPAVQAPPVQIDRAQLGADLTRTAKAAGQPTPPSAEGGQAYDPDFLDVLSAGLRGFAGQHGPSMREQRWNQEQDRSQQAERDAYEAWLGQRRADAQDAAAERAESAQGIMGRRLDIAEEGLGIRREGLGLRREGMEGAERRFDEGTKRRDRQLDISESAEERRGDIDFAARRAAATAAAGTKARDAAHAPTKLAEEERAEGRADRARELSAAAEVAMKDKTAKQELRRKHTKEIVGLEKLREKLLARKAAGANSLPKQVSFIERGGQSVYQAITGQSALSPEDASLDTDITALGLSSYINTANNAPNSEREQQVAGELYRGDGTADGALLRIQERLDTIEREQEAYLSDGAPEPAAPKRKAQRAKPAPASDDGFTWGSGSDE